jgi:hypothetical protein
MMIPKAKLFTCLYLCLTCSIPLSGQASLTQINATSCRQFVETFYKWYLETASRNHGLTDSDLALKDRPYLFSSELLLRLREESEVQNQAGSNLVGLDIDPFSGPDGAGDRFALEKITTKGDLCWAEVHFDEYKIPGVKPELAYKNGRWIFVNFYYPNPSNPKVSDLLSELKAARASWKAQGLLKDKKP